MKQSEWLLMKKKKVMKKKEVLFFKKYMQEKLFKATLKTQVFCILLTNTYVVYVCLHVWMSAGQVLW